MNYYEQPIMQPVILATYSEGDLTVELTVLDEDGEYFSADVFTTDSEGYLNYKNNSGSVSKAEALNQFELDLDCFLGVEYTEAMNTEHFTKWMQ
jgi:hypothetical protein